MLKPTLQMLSQPLANSAGQKKYSQVLLVRGASIRHRYTEAYNYIPQVLVSPGHGVYLEGRWPRERHLARRADIVVLVTIPWP